MTLAVAHLPAELVSTLAGACVAIGSLIIVAGALLSLRAGRWAGLLLANYLSVGVEFFLAGGLVRLAGDQTFAALGLAAVIIILRRMISFGIQLAARATAR